MKTILSISILLSVNAFSQLHNNNGIVEDSSTSLVWQDHYDDGYGNEVSVVDSNWTSALIYCENLSLDGFSNWRLPNINELMSITDENSYSPSIKSSFMHTEDSYYWSSTTSTNKTEKARVADFRYGKSFYGYDKSSTRFVRCVGDLPHYKQIQQER